MSTVIDSLVVLLGLDPSGYKAGEKEAEASMKRTKASVERNNADRETSTEASMKRTKETSAKQTKDTDQTNSASAKKAKEEAERLGKDREAHLRQAGMFFSKVRNQVLALAATFTAGMGLKSFLNEMTQTDAAAGRTARNIGVTTEMLTAWQGVAERAGGSAAGIAGSMQGLSQQFQQLALTGQSSVVPYFRAVGVEIADANGKMRPMNDILLDLSDKLSKMDPARAQALGRGLGIDEGTVNVLMQGRAAIGALLVEQQKLGAASKADADAAALRQKEFNALGQASADLGRKLLTALTPALLAIVKGLTAIAGWFAEHPVIFGTFAAALGLAAAAVTVFLTVASVSGFLSLAAAVFSVAPAATAAAGALGTAATAATAATATVGTGLLGLLAALAKSALLVAAAGAVGYAIGTALFKAFIENTPFSDWIGKKIAQTLAFFGNKDAQESLDAEERGKGPQVAPKAAPTIAAGPMPQGTGQRDALGRLVRPKPGAAESATAQPGQAGKIQLIAPAQPGQSSARPMASSNRAQAESDIQRFVQMGWTREQASGIAANVQRESAGNEKSIGDNGQAYGLAQWHPDRQREFAKQFGKDIRNSTRDEQLQFINYELRQGKEQAAGNALAKATDAGQAAAIVSQKYERPADVQGEAAKRAALAVSLNKAQQPDPALRGGAATALAANNTSNVNTSSSHAETHIGKVEVNLPNATDGQSVAKGLGPALQKSMSVAAQANFGLTT